MGDLKLEINNYNPSDPEINLATDLVEAFEYNITIDWEAVYGVGSLAPLEYFIRGAPEVETVITLQTNKSVSPDLRSLLCTPALKDITLKVFDCGENCSDTKTLVRRFHSPCSKLVEYNNISTNLDVLTAELVFRSVNTPLSLLGEILS